MFNHVSARNAWEPVAGTQRGRAMIQREAIRAYGGGFEFTYFAGAGPDGRLESGDAWHIWSTPSEQWWDAHVDAKLRMHMGTAYPTERDTERSEASTCEGQLLFAEALYGPLTNGAGDP